MSGEPYSPERRTALLLTGVGTAGAYHAGVLRALHEAGVKVDVVAGRGVGAVGALFFAIDGAQRLWDDKGLWRSSAVARAYEWRPMLRIAAWAIAISFLLVAVPLAAVAAGFVVLPIDFVLKLVGISANGLVTPYLQFAERMFQPDLLPTWLPRIVLIVLSVAAGAGLGGAVLDARGRRTRDPFWWHALRSPLAAAPFAELCWGTLWDLIRGASALRQPPRLDLARRYSDLLAENLGQPGFRELLIAAHDVDAHRDVVFALVGESKRLSLFRRATSSEAAERRAELIDLSGVGRGHLADAVAAALTVPVATALHPIAFAADSHWRGETHRLSDRPAALWRLLEELAALDVQQVILVAAVAEPSGPHALVAARLDPRAQLGEYLASAEAALVRDIAREFAGRDLRLFAIQPEHNPVGPFDFSGGFDDRSERREPLGELLARGYEDAYRQFIEPVVGASGEAVGSL